MSKKLTKEKIIVTAFEILSEQQTISGLSMRKLAMKLNVQAPALYWHFKDKQHLLQTLAEVMEKQLVIPDATLPWHEQLTGFMEGYFDLYHTYPCGVEIEINTVPASKERLQHIEQMLQLLIQAGFSLALSHQIINTLQYLLVGLLMDARQEALLHQKAVSQDPGLLQYISEMRTQAEALGLKAISSEFDIRFQRDLKREFLESVSLYLAGLMQKSPDSL